ncbi:MAG: Glucose-regulated metallo-peptidase [Chloroflexota bacterium]
MHVTLDLNIHAHLPVTRHDSGITIGQTVYSSGSVRINDSAAIAVSQLISGWQMCAMRMPLAGLVFQVSKELTSLGHFFPLIHTLTDAQRFEFRTRLNALLQSTDIAVTYTTQAGLTATPLILRVMVLGQIVSCFWGRPEIVSALQRTKPSVALYADRMLYERTGGVGGGCYLPHEHRIMLEANRLFEGFYTPIPNVSPFLHEFGHMLDGTHMRLNQLPHCYGRLPLMHDQAFSLWQKAKYREVQCYTAWYHQRPPSDGQMPLGHPYVFQNDGEFLAGHWEMFWRNPHAMAQQTPHLFDAFKNYVNQDPRTSLAHDYLGYVEGNRAFYQSGQQPWPTQMRYDMTDD